MFTGIIEETGTIKSVKKGSKSAVLNISAVKIMNDVKVGDSIAVNGVCLTATTVSAAGFTADVMAETLRRSSLGVLTPGDKVNLERAMLMNGRFGGHIVSGHIDGTGKIISCDKEDNAVWVTVSADKSILKYIIPKGSIAIDGISLTVAYVDDVVFKVSLIPHTAKETTLLSKKKGHIVNLENDIIGKYVDKLINFKDDSNINNSINNSSNNSSNNSGLSMESLMENGFI